jgi:hypothetical protein
MTREVRPDPRPRDSGRWGCAGLLLAITLILVAAGTTEHEKPGPMCAVGGLGIVAWFLKQLYWPYWCPVCGDRLKMIRVGWDGPEDQADKKPIYHDCPRCEVQWDSGLVWYRDNSD